MPTPGVRASKRLRAGPAAEAPSVVVGELGGATGSAEWARALLREPPEQEERGPVPRKRRRGSGGGSSGGPQLLWDRARMHQHLDLSGSGRTVVTTGCAGYGAALARRDRGGTAEVRRRSGGGAARGKGAADQSVVVWELEVLAEGVGGFAFGVTAAGTGKPFKSLGSRPDAWVLHSSGALLHNRTQTPLGPAAEYGAGDAVGVRVASSGALSFSLNGKVLPSGVELPSGKYLLCVQPYMGGAARLC